MTEDDLARGAHERVLTQALVARLTDRRTIDRPMSDDESLELLAHAIHETARRALSQATSVAERTAMAADAIRVLTGGDEPIEPTRILTYLDPAAPDQPPLPSLPLHQQALVTNEGGIRLHAALSSEFDTSDGVTFLVSFLRFSGYRLLAKDIRRTIARGQRVRVLTTTYMGITEQEAIEHLVRDGADVRISYEESRTRLHAKAWIFHRSSGFSTAYVGSSNLSRAALVDGMEWNVRVTQAAEPQLYDEIAATADHYWNGDDFVPYDADEFRVRARLARRLENERWEATTPIDLAAERGATDLYEDAPYVARRFQTEILESLAAERLEHDRWRNLVVAATGTGKTVIAALDYWRLHELDPTLGARPRLLFVAHRRELLEKARSTFRRAGRDASFGELLVGGERPRDWNHVFASVQSLQNVLPELAHDHFDVVIIDEFHHAAAPTYEAIRDGLAPRMLLGLTATPERGDGQSVTDWTHGRISHEIRLWDALHLDLVSPFHYYGIDDETDLRRIAFRAGRYVQSELENVLTGDDIRARWVISEIRGHVRDVHAMRAIVFCVSVAHAEFMAEHLRAAGVRAEAVSGQTGLEDREMALDRLANGDLNVVCAVDLLNEGIDLPLVDTVVFLRPTESAVVFLQQLGRGLRKHASKSHLTVLDFVGRQHADFRFDQRIAALTGTPRGQLRTELEAGFPRLPAGSQITLARQVEQQILDSIRRHVQPNTRGLEAAIRDLQQAGLPITLENYLDTSGFDLENLHGSTITSWTSLLRRVDLVDAPPGDDESRMSRRIRALLHADDHERLDVWSALARDASTFQGFDARQQRLAQMLLAALYGEADAAVAPDELAHRLQTEPALIEELLSTFAVLATRPWHHHRPWGDRPDVPLHLHAHYTRREIQAAFGFLDSAWREGVRYLPDDAVDLFAYTLDKSKGAYTPTTLYADRPLSERRIQWESQSNTSHSSPTGRRYVSRKSEILLFQRLDNHAAYLFLGPAGLESSTGDKPMRCVLRLAHPMPEQAYLDAVRAVS